MNIALHKNARTTPAAPATPTTPTTGAEIAASHGNVGVLSAQYGASASTIVPRPGWLNNRSRHHSQFV